MVMKKNNNKSFFANEEVSEKEKWLQLINMGRHINDYSDDELAVFYKELQLFLETFPFKKGYSEQAFTFFKLGKKKLNRHSRYMFYRTNLSILEYNWKNTAQQDAGVRTEYYYQIILKIKKLKNYLEGKNAIYDKEFDKESHEKRTKLREVGFTGEVKNYQIGFSQVYKPQNFIAYAIDDMQHALRDWYSVDARIWDMIRIDKGISEGYIDGPESAIDYNVEYVNKMWEWIPYLQRSTDNRAYHLMLKWMAGVLTSSKHIAEKYLVGTDHLSFEQEFGSFKTMKGVKEANFDLAGFMHYIDMECRLEEIMYDQKGNHLFQRLLTAIKEEGLEEQLLSYTPPKAISYEEYNDIENGPYPQGEETYEEWCSRKELYLSLVPSFLSHHANSDSVDVDFLSGERNKYFAFLYNLMKQEFIITRQFFFETSQNFLNAAEEVDKGFYVERIKQCYLQLYGLFDRVATFLNDYFNLSIHKVNYREIWHEKGEEWVHVRKILKSSMNSNPFLRTLYSLSRDLFYTKDNWQENLEGDLSELANIRNKIAHSFIYVCVSENDDSLAKHDVYSITIEDLMLKTDALLTRVRDVLVYLVLFLLAEEKKV